MDTLTQLTLGAAVGEATMGRKVGNRAALWGAICATLPDFDSFIPYDDAVATFTYHRSASHSLIVLALFTPLMVWLILKIHPKLAQYKKHWFLLVFLAFETHPLLDAFTVYGTQLFWPVYIYPVSWSTIFIVDPLYTLPLMVGVLSALITNREKKTGHLVNSVGLILAYLYLGWTVIAKYHIEGKVLESLQVQEIGYSRLLTTPAPLNSVVWRIVAMDANGYYEGYLSVLDRPEDMELDYYHSNDSLLTGIESHWPVQRLKWFTHGFYKVTLDDKDILMTDLRMGQEPNYVFTFKVAVMGNPHPEPVTSVLVSSFITGGQ